AGVIVLFFDTFGQLLRFFTAVGVDLQQAIATLLQLSFQRVVLLSTGFDQLIKALGVFRRREVTDQIAMHLVINGAARRAGMFKRIQAFVVPANQNGLGGFLQIRNVDLNSVRLTDTIQTADS